MDATKWPEKYCSDLNNRAIVASITTHRLSFTQKLVPL